MSPSDRSHKLLRAAVPGPTRMWPKAKAGFLTARLQSFTRDPPSTAGWRASGEPMFIWPALTSRWVRLSSARSGSGPLWNAGELLMCPQGLGLFAARDIEKQSMVIEYNGTILRNEVATRKERVYRSQVVFSWRKLQSRGFFFSFYSCFFSFLTEPSGFYVPHRQWTCCWCHSDWRSSEVQIIFIIFYYYTYYYNILMRSIEHYSSCVWLLMYKMLKIVFCFPFRYINHSCAPNCVAEVVTFERGYKIIISCVRRVEKGEEVGVLL